MEKRWYIIHVFSGAEEFVVKALEEKINKYKMDQQITGMVIPKENVIEIKDGKKVVSEKRSFPGYILVEMEMNDKNWYFVRNTPKVTGFVGAGKKPRPLLEKEVSTILKHIETTQATPKPKYHFEVGEAVKIIDGPFLNFNGVVESVSEEKNLLKVTVTIFGRPTPVDLDFLQVEKI
ncbi:MAG: transcription termination/antitermination factor NusG [Candidatus Aminicenantes bacterium]|jgi:transcriptional antiterminator NusG|nr:transcription termination/antitermination factor NusG [Candidatus Aminicenantes bacterium]